MMPERMWNSDQLKAIGSFGGNILVSAAAGSGKTAVLVERVIGMLTNEENPVDADRLLIVTFTNLAAAEMRSRINARLAEEFAANPEKEFLRRQLLLMERAHIGTMHSFCLEVVKENTSALGLMPEPNIADDDEAADLSFSALEDTIEEYYKNGSPVFTELAETLGGGRSDSGLSEAVLGLYGFISAMPHYDEWLSEKAGMYDTDLPVKESPWGKILLENAGLVLGEIRENIVSLAEECKREKHEKYYEAMQSDLAVIDRILISYGRGSWDDFGYALALPDFDRFPTVRGADETLKAKIKTARDGYKKKISELGTDFSVSEEEFREDIADLYPKIKCLFELTLDYAKQFRKLKQEKQLLDFTDLEQMTLSLLTEKDGSGNYIRTEIAKEISSRFDYILIDECQDNNKVQETIFRNVSKGDNLFYVGDVKQSIYRFRQAMPELFLEKRSRWPLLDEEEKFPATIILGKNYRSRKNIAGAVNFIFRQLMSKKSAEIEYDESEMLIPEASFPEDEKIRNEFLLIESDENSVKAEADSVASHIYNMVLNGTPVFDGKTTRPVRYSDICILLRSPKGRIETFLSALRNLGINCRSENDKGFLSRPEIAAVVDVLKAVDNPMLDIPLAGAMLSEMFLFTPDDLAEIRTGSRKLPLYSSVKLAAENGNKKAADFLAALDSLRKAAAYERSDALIERLYDMTAFPQVMQSCPEGELKLANLRLLIKYASDREKAGSHGLCAFIRFINRLEERDSDLKPAGSTGVGESCVRVMSVHGSKGLEFPVVFLCGTGKKFHTYRGDEIRLHPELGFACPRRDPLTGARFPTVPQLALKYELRRSDLAEEMRILYVALTRPKENLIISCCAKNIGKMLMNCAAKARTGEKISPLSVQSAGSEAEWLLTALLRHPDARELREIAGLEEKFVIPDGTRWKFTVDFDSENEAEEAEEEDNEKAPIDEELYEILKEREKWVYPFAAAEKIPSKAGVSSLTHGEMHKKLLFEAKYSSGELSGAERGTALHTFMQFCDFEKAKKDPAAEISRLEEKLFITPKQAKAIDPGKVKTFFESPLYKRIENSPEVQRELRFLRGISARELGYENASEEDKITVQGVADCVFEEDGKLTVLDYKTDHVDDIEELRERYAAQLNMYKKLLSEALGKEVTRAVIWSFRFGKELEV